MDIATFRLRFQSFGKVSPARVQDALDAAARRMSQITWGTLYDDGQGYLAAHLLAFDPQGQMSRLNKTAPDKTVYWDHYQALLALVSPAAMVL